MAKPEISASFGEAEVEDEFRGTIDPYLWGLVNSLIIPSTLPSEIRRLGLNITDPAVPALQYASVLNTKTLSLLTSPVLALSHPPQLGIHANYLQRYPALDCCDESEGRRDLWSVETAGTRLAWDLCRR